MIISNLNSIRFRKVDSSYPNFNNTLLEDELFYNDKIENYCQRFLSTDTITVQVRSDSDTVPTVTLYENDNTSHSLTTTLKSSYDQNDDGTNDLFFFEFEIDMSAYDSRNYVKVTQGSDTYVSEPFESSADLLTELQNGKALMLEYYNEDNAFGVDFSTDITYKLYVESILKDYEFGGDSLVYDNQNELTKLKETAARLLNFRTLHIPRYLSEIIRLASSCDNLVVNGVSYVREDLPEVEPVEGNNLVEYSMVLNDKEYLGVNSHDVGFDCDTVTTTGGEIMIQTEENASGSVSFSVPAGYQVHTIRAQWVSGTSVEIKLGTTIGGNELVYPFNVTETITDVTAAIHRDLNRDSATTIYATVSDGVANLDLQLIENKE